MSTFRTPPPRPVTTDPLRVRLFPNDSDEDIQIQEIPMYDQFSFLSQKKPKITLRFFLLVEDLQSNSNSTVVKPKIE